MYIHMYTCHIDSYVVGWGVFASLLFVITVCCLLYVAL